MQKKGFPESYDLPKLLALPERHQGRAAAGACPVYSHLTYDFIPNQWTVDRPARTS